MNNTLIKGMHLMEILAHTRGGLALGELALQAGMPKSGVHRLLQALVQLGYVEQRAADGSYAATLKVWELGYAVMSRFDVRTAAPAVMSRLLDETRETVHLSILDGREVVYIDKLDSPEPVRSYSEIGGRAPAHCVATGKVLLAAQPRDFLRALSTSLSAHTPHTVTEPQRFLAEMDKVHRQGYAINRGEWRESVCGAAAPICDSTGQVIAAIGISGPADRLKPAQLKAFVPNVMQAADALTRAIATRQPGSRSGKTSA